MNKIIYPPLIIIAAYIPIAVYAFVDHTNEAFVALGIWTLLTALFLLKCIDNIWIYRRLSAMTPNHYKTVKVNVIGTERQGVYDCDSQILFIHSSKDKKLTIERIMFIEPKHYQKKFEEQKYQFTTQLEQTKIPLQGSLSEPNTISFTARVTLEQRHATPANIKTIRDVFIHLSKDDYQQAIYTAFATDDNTALWLETRQGNPLRAMRVAEGEVIERFNFDASGAQPSDELMRLLGQVNEEGRMGNLNPDSDLAEQADFERFWN